MSSFYIVLLVCPFPLLIYLWLRWPTSKNCAPPIHKKIFRAKISKAKRTFRICHNFIKIQSTYPKLILSITFWTWQIGNKLQIYILTVKHWINSVQLGLLNLFLESIEYMNFYLSRACRNTYLQDPLFTCKQRPCKVDLISPPILLH